jgi:photosystem II stability/assembly factor-like uncharacterized protein
MIAVVDTVAGPFAVDLDEEELEPWVGELTREAEPVLNLPRVVAATAVGATVIAVVDAKPPLLVSYDSGSTWRESGRGLPPGRAVALSADDPDVAVYASRNRLYVTRDGAVFWTALAVELPEIRARELREG